MDDELKYLINCLTPAYRQDLAIMVNERLTSIAGDSDADPEITALTEVQLALLPSIPEVITE